MKLRMPLGGAFLLSFVCFATAGPDLQVLESYACDSNGVRRPVRVGENFWVGTRFRVSGGSLNTSFKYRAESAFARIDSDRLSFGTTPGDYWVYWGPIPALMDAPFEVRTTLDPERRVRESNRTNNSTTFMIDPLGPSEAIELYDRKNLYGRLGFSLQFKRGSAVPTRLTSWIPIPTTETFQHMADVSDKPAFDELTSDPFGQPLLARTTQPTSTATLQDEIEMWTAASAVRSNLQLLKLYSSSSDPQEREWLRAESLIEVGRPELASWVRAERSALGREPLSAVETAEALYRSVLRRCSYQLTSNAAPSALSTLKKKKGDCGALSSLFVALCRTAGIPARTVSGFAYGSNNWHVWAEFHVNGAGWVPADPAYAEGRLPSGSDLPIYFGVIPELNQRIATAYGFDRRVGSQAISMLQSPAVFWQGRNVKIQKLSVFSELAVR